MPKSVPIDSSCGVVPFGAITKLSDVDGDPTCVPLFKVPMIWPAVMRRVCGFWFVCQAKISSLSWTLTPGAQLWIVVTPTLPTH
jgi:hypothetical protein